MLHQRLVEQRAMERLVSTSDAANSLSPSHLILASLMSLAGGGKRSIIEREPLQLDMHGRAAFAGHHRSLITLLTRYVVGLPRPTVARYSRLCTRRSRSRELRTSAILSCYLQPMGANLNMSLRHVLLNVLLP